MIFAVTKLLACVVSNILNRLKDLKELQEKSTIENIQFEIESGLVDLAEKMQRFNDEVADWDDDNQKVSFSEIFGIHVPRNHGRPYRTENPDRYGFWYVGGFLVRDLLVRIVVRIFGLDFYRYGMWYVFRYVL